MNAEKAKSATGETGRPVRMAAWQTSLAVAVLILGAAATLWLTLDRQRAEERRTEQEFHQFCEKQFDRTLREIQWFMEVLDSIRQLLGISNQVTTEAFDEIARKGMLHQRRVLGAYGFAQRLPDEFRAVFEAQGKTGATRPIVRADGAGGFTPVERKTVYYPLTYQMPPGGLGVPTGYDFGSRAEDVAAISAMTRFHVFALGGTPGGRNHNTVAATNTNGADGMYMFAPIFQGPEDTPRALDGFAVGWFQPAKILQTILPEGMKGVDFRLEATNTDNEEKVAPEPWRFTREFSLANQSWRFSAEAGAAYRVAARGRLPGLTAAGGAGLTLLLSGALFWVGGRTRRIERLVRRRTAELAEANRKLAAVMEERRELEDAVLRSGGDERARIGRDLHDSLGQKLTGAMYLFGAFRRHAKEADGDAGAREAEQIAVTLKEAVTQVRRIAQGLAPVALTEDGLPDALRQLAEESAALSGLDVEFFAEREGRPKDAATAEHLYLIAREAVHNAAKHSGGSRVVITLDYEEHNGWLCIEDNGHGRLEGRVPDLEGGNGLRIMRHRAEVFGGTLEVGPVEGGGLRVRIRFPAEEDRASAV